MEGVGLAHLYPALAWSVVLLAIMDSQDVWKLLAEEAKSLSYRNAMFQPGSMGIILLKAIDEHLERRNQAAP
jgi:hypothetical protein